MTCTIVWQLAALNAIITGTGHRRTCIP